MSGKGQLRSNVGGGGSVYSEVQCITGNGHMGISPPPLVLEGQVPRLNHGPTCFPIQNT